MKVNPAKDIIQINGKIIKKLIFMLDAFLANKPRIKITVFYPQKQKAILDFLLNKFQKISFIIKIVYFLRRVLSLFKNNGDICHQEGHPKFNSKKKYLSKKNSLILHKKLIKWGNEITLDNKFIHPNSIITIRQKIEYMIFKEIFNEVRNRQLTGKLNSLGYKVLGLKIIRFWKILLRSFKEVDLKLFNKFVLKDIRL